MKSLKHKNIHTNFKHNYLITFNSSHFTQGLCKDLKDKIAKKLISTKISRCIFIEGHCIEKLPHLCSWVVLQQKHKC
jgi:hypothetical protein